MDGEIAEVVLRNCFDREWFDVYLGRVSIEQGMVFLRKGFVADDMEPNNEYPKPGSHWEPLDGTLVWPVARIHEVRVVGEDGRSLWERLCVRGFARVEG